MTSGERKEEVTARKVLERYSILFLLLLISLVGCGSWEGAGGEDKTPVPPQIGLVVPVSEEGAAGTVLQAALQEGMAGLGGTVEVITTEPSAYITSLRELADGGKDPVWILGEDMVPALAEVAPLYPERKFVLVNGSLSAPNVVSLTFREEEPAFLAGIIAGAESNTGRVGYIAAPGTENLQYAIAAGLYEVEPAVQEFGQTLAGPEPGQAAAVAEGLLGRGADVIILASGVNVGELVELLAEREQRAALISLDSYSHPEGEEIILASLGWDLALVVEETQAKLLEGFAAGVFNFGVEDGLLVVREGSQLSPQARYLLGSYRRQLAAGAISIPSREEELLDFQNSSAAGVRAQGEAGEW